MRAEISPERTSALGVIRAIAVRHEAEVLARYLIGEAPSELATRLYEQAMDQMPAPDARDEHRIAIAMRHPSLLGPLDAALAIRAPESALRHRTFAMSAILECQPELAARFLPESSRRFGHVRSAFVALRAAARLVAGLAILLAVDAT